MSEASKKPKKLHFKGDKIVKKKKRTHREVEDEDSMAALARADPTGWVFPETTLEISGPSFIILPTEPLTCLAWDAVRQRVYAATLPIPQAPEGMDELSSSEILDSLEPTDVNHVWVISRLSGSEGVVSLRSGAGTFLTANTSGSLTADTPSRGPLEAFTPVVSPPTAPSPGAGLLHPFPTLTLETAQKTYLSYSKPAASIASGKLAFEVRCDAEDVDAKEKWIVKCQREYVHKARLEASGIKQKKKVGDGTLGTLEDEIEKNRQVHGTLLGRTVISHADRKDIKKARKEGRVAEAMLDRRAAIKSDRYAK